MHRQILPRQVLAGAILILASILYGTLVFASVCSKSIPHGAEIVRDFWLCESSHTGKPETYNCRDYKSGSNHYRLFYKSGTVPKAIALVDEDGFDASLHYINMQDEDLFCEISPPEGVPESAIHLGSGICNDNQDQAIPCSVFRYAPGRQTEILHYMVFYEKDGSGPLLIDEQKIGSNQDALTAELAYQIGVELLFTSCRQQQAHRYLQYAYELFPNFEEYRDAYQLHEIEPTLSGKKAPCIDVISSK